MKKLTIKSTLSIFVLGIFFITSCSKEKQFERTLTKKGGDWNIDQLAYNLVSQNFGFDSVTSIGFGFNFGSGTETDAGTVTFTENTMRYDFTLNGVSFSESFNITLDGETFSAADVKQGFDLSSLFNPSSGFDITQNVIAYSGTISSNDIVTIEGTETKQIVDGFNIGQEVLTLTFTLSKK